VYPARAFSWPARMPRREIVSLIVLRWCSTPAVAFFASFPAFDI